MNPQIATIACVVGIMVLFFMDRDASARTSKALWIPLVWMLIIGSRGVTLWFQTEPSLNLTARYTTESPIDAAVYGVLIAAGVLILNSRSKQVKSFLQVNLPLLLFFSYCAISILWADSPFISLKRWIKAVGDIVMVLVVVTDPDPRAAAKRFLCRAGFVLLPLSVLLIKYYPSLGTFWDEGNHITLYNGVTTQKNGLGQICMVFGLGSLWSFLSALEEPGMRRRAERLFAHGVILLTAMLLILKADSMTSLSCLLLAGTVMILSTRQWVAKRTGGVQALIAGAIVLPLFAVFIDSAGLLLQVLGRTPTLTGRTSIWRAVLSLNTNPLVGTGFESFWLGGRLQTIWALTAPGIQEAHNGYLEVYLNLGIIGVCLLGGLIVTGYANAYSVFRRDPSEGSFRLAIVTAGVIYGLTEAGFRMMSPIWMAFLLAISVAPLSVQSWQYQQASVLPLTRGLPRKQVRILQ
jgi:O-antigen ligase